MSEVGVEGRLARLLQGHRAGLYGFILACVRNHEEARAILEQVDLAVRDWQGQAPADHALVPWARELARTKILAFRRFDGRARPLNPVLVERLAEAANRVESFRPAADYEAALRSCLEKLPPKGRLLLALRYSESVRSVDELAAQLGRNVPVAAALLKETKALLRECVERRASAKFDHGITRSQ